MMIFGARSIRYGYAVLSGAVFLSVGCSDRIAIGAGAMSQDGGDDPPPDEEPPDGASGTEGTDPPESTDSGEYTCADFDHCMTLSVDIERAFGSFLQPPTTPATLKFTVGFDAQVCPGIDWWSQDGVVIAASGTTPETDEWIRHAVGTGSGYWAAVVPDSFGKSPWGGPLVMVNIVFRQTACPENMPPSDAIETTVNLQYAVESSIGEDGCALGLFQATLIPEDYGHVQRVSRGDPCGEEYDGSAANMVGGELTLE